MKQIYSQKQCIVAAFIGGPLAAIYMFTINMGELRGKEAKKWTFIAGMVAFSFLTFVALMLPGDMVGFYLTFFCVGIVAYLTLHFDIPNFKHIMESTALTRFTNLNVAILSVVSQIINIGIIIILYSNFN